VTAQQAAALAGPALVVVLAAVGIPLMVAGLRLLNTWAAHIQNATIRDLAMTAVRAVEQTMAAEPSPDKKTVALRMLIAAGVPVDAASMTVEAAVHALNTAATQVLTTTDAPATVTVTAPPPVPPDPPATH
jgi:ABC-type phosphate transport system auxiliary subunit